MGLERAVKRILRQHLRRRGWVVFRTWEPLVRSLDCVPPLESHFETGGPETYYLPPGYTPRTAESYFNDTPSTDEFQREVYQLARWYADREQLLSVCDVGCGSAYKLMHNFQGYQRIGVDLPETVAWLKRKYPEGSWLAEDMRCPSNVRAGLVISSDVIEHVADPNVLLAYIKSMQPRLVVLSTPDRNLLLNGRHCGPPENPRHIREWSYLEFHRYIADQFEILEHFYSNPFQATQMILARLPRR